MIVLSEWVADNVEDNLDLDAPIEVGQEDANYGGIGAKEETNENVDHMEDDFHELGLNNINIINRIMFLVINFNLYVELFW
jgi:hypothetical protein